MKIKKLSKKFIANMTIAITLVSYTNIAQALELVDINGHWAKKQIQDFIDKGYINGYPEDSTFRPENSITRAEFIKVVNKVFGYELKQEIEFIDVYKNQWYYSEVEKAVKAGYIKGYPEDNTFRPNDPIKREEAAKIISTIMNIKDENFDKIESYSDKYSVSSWAKPYVEGALEAKYINGYSEDNTLKPTNHIKRAEAVTILNRTLNEDKKYTNEEGIEVRNGAGKEYDIIGKLPMNEEVTVLEYIGEWSKIKYKDGIGYIEKKYLSETTTEMMPLPNIPLTPEDFDSPEVPEIIDPSQDINQENIVVEKDKNDSGELTGIAVSAGEGIGIGYSIYSEGTWIYNSNGGSASSKSKKPIEGVKISFTTPRDNVHLFYRTKVKNKGWQAWVKDNKISGEIGNGNVIESIEIRVIVAEETDKMLKETIAINVESNNSINQKQISQGVGEKLIYNLRKKGYNVVEIKEDIVQAINMASLNEVDKFINIQFNNDNTIENGTKVYYSNHNNNEKIAKKIVENISTSFNFINKGHELSTNEDLQLLNSPSLIIKPCYTDNISDINKFAEKGSQAYEIMANEIINAITN